MVVVSTNGRQDTEESIVLGMDFSSNDRYSQRPGGGSACVHPHVECRNHCLVSVLSGDRLLQIFQPNTFPEIHSTLFISLKDVTNGKATAQLSVFSIPLSLRLL